MRIFAGIVSIGAMAGMLCGCPGAKKVGFDTVEQARTQARENAQLVAQNWRANNQMYAKFHLYMRGDSTISPKCPQGDGWATVDLRDDQGRTEKKLKCSTVSMSIGCLESNDFKTKSYASEDGRCNPDLPHPIKKIQN